MPSARVDEDWSDDDLDMLLELAFSNLDESRRCHAAGCDFAAFVMLAAAFEATLLGMVIANEYSLRARGGWPLAASHQHLTDLVTLGRKQGWLSDDAIWAVTEVLNKVRTMAAHPGAYVRGMRSAPSDFEVKDPNGYEVCLDIVLSATEQLKDAHGTGLEVAGSWREGIP